MRSTAYKGHAQDLSLLDMAHILNRYRVLLLGMTLLGTGLAMISLSLIKPIYKAHSTVLIQPYNVNALKNLIATEDFGSQDNIVESFVKLLQSRELIGNALANNKFPDLSATEEGFLQDYLPGDVKQELRPMSLDQQIDHVLNRLEIARDGRSHAIKIGYSSKNAEHASDMANKIAAAFIDLREQQAFKGTGKARSLYDEQARDLKNQMNAAEIALERALFDLSDEHAEGLSSAGLDLVNINHDLIAARAEVAAKRKELQKVKRMASSGEAALLYENLGGSAVLQNLHALKNQTLRKEAELSAKFGARHPDLIDTRAELKRLDTRIRGERLAVVQKIEVELDQASARQQTLADELEKLKGRSIEQQKAENLINQLERKANQARERYDAYTKRYQTLIDFENTQGTDAQLISAAAVPLSPFFPNPNLVILTGLIACWTTGLIIIFLREQGDHGFRSPVELSNLTGLSCLSLIPYRKEAVSGRLPPLEYVRLKPRSRLAESVRGLLPSLTQTKISGRAHTIMICSALPDEGKSTIAAMTAYLAHKEGWRVLLIDADLRRPSIASIFDIQTKGGLYELLAQEAKLGEVIIRRNGQGPDLIAGNPPHQGHIQKTVGPGRLSKFIEPLRRHYDMIIVDSAPLMAVADTRMIAPLTDSILFLARWNKTPRSIVDHCLNQLNDAGGKIAGTALTMVDFQAFSKMGEAKSRVVFKQLSAYYQD